MIDSTDDVEGLGDLVLDDDEAEPDLWEDRESDSMDREEELACGWDRSGCEKKVCVCHDNSSRPRACSHCGCRPVSKPLHEASIPGLDGLEVMRALVCSTAHLTEAEGQTDAPEIPLPAMGWEHGYCVYVKDWESVIDDEEKAEWPGLCATAAFAVARGFEWVRFDCDAEEIDELPKYEW